MRSVWPSANPAMALPASLATRFATPEAASARLRPGRAPIRRPDPLIAASTRSRLASIRPRAPVDGRAAAHVVRSAPLGGSPDAHQTARRRTDQARPASITPSPAWFRLAHVSITRPPPPVRRPAGPQHHASAERPAHPLTARTTGPQPTRRPPAARWRLIISPRHAHSPRDPRPPAPRPPTRGQGATRSPPSGDTPTQAGEAGGWMLVFSLQNRFQRRGDPRRWKLGDGGTPAS